MQINITGVKDLLPLLAENHLEYLQLFMGSFIIFLKIKYFYLQYKKQDA